MGGHTGLHQPLHHAWGGKKYESDYQDKISTILSNTSYNTLLGRPSLNHYGSIVLAFSQEVPIDHGAYVLEGGKEVLYN